MEARSVDEIPIGDDWQYEPKWDGFRCLVFRDGAKIFLQSKAGQPLARYFPDVLDAVSKLKAKKFVLDGELVIPIRGAFSFDELQLRLHPAASRVQKLAAAHPAMFIVFDLLVNERGKNLVRETLESRRAALEKFARTNFKSKGAIRLSPATPDLKIGEEVVRQSWRQSRRNHREATQRALRLRRTNRRGESETHSHGRLCCRWFSLCHGRKGYRFAAARPLR